MNEILTNELRDQYLKTLSPEQTDFIRNHVRRGKKTIFANSMAKDKGIVLPEDLNSEEIEHLLEDWVLIDYIDNGFVNPDTPCECGRPLRYQYIVKHNKSNEQRTFGINHFEEHTGLPPNIVKLIKSGFQTIEYEMDELLIKIFNNWNIEEEVPFTLDEDYIYPIDMQKHLDANVPLLDRQIKRVKQQILSLSSGPKREVTDREFEAKDTQKISPFYATETQEPDPINLFSEEEMPLPKKENDLKPYALASEYRDAVFGYLTEGVTSTRIICELLMKNYHAPSERYYSGRPKIYVSVCFYLDLLVSKEKALHIGSLNLDDRYYKLT
ncbi:hypothetical protein CR203_14925 [Salipaludibacillus neizhouensis]|uniref:DUF3895 domain-containing protein n=1 Tax=Salipaludibacillus neizhouensis TaxID=885475 RepID=A0A3A9K5D6_9BACI|nr:DUF3895 domain-containing protein [Salipaludibacillus neizhouensis]RKL66578.1 hypothetical protein CR203_14925 [Salipaludibacillus neizhouensis]